CLCGGASCLLCSCCPNSRNSTLTRLIYAFILLLTTLVSCIMLREEMEPHLKKIPGFCDRGFQISMTDRKTDEDCDVLVGYKAVYRINFALAIFFFIFFLLMLKVKTSKDPRAAVHNGFWFFKIAALIGIMVGAFYIPGGSFTTAWFTVGMAGAAFFILIQLVLLVDGAHSWNEIWVNRMEEGNPRLWYAALLSATSLFYILSVIFVGLLYTYYTKPDGCTENKFFISINLILCVVVSIISVHPKIQEHQPRSGLLQSSVITLYTMYLTWSAMSNEPGLSINRILCGLLLKENNYPSPMINTIVFFFFPNSKSLVVMQAQTGFEPARSSAYGWHPSRQATGGSVPITQAARAPATYTGGGGFEHSLGLPNSNDNYSTFLFSLLNFELIIMKLYSVLTLPSWQEQNPDAKFQNMTSKWPAVWVKISSSWVCLLLYVWTLVAPLILTNRDFS
uniref:Serine incorporator 3 n=1 Tax=Otolemur garnettii TaxID=30611 RepID=H0XNH4_OTOGA